MWNEIVQASTDVKGITTNLISAAIWGLAGLMLFSLYKGWRRLRSVIQEETRYFHGLVESYETQAADLIMAIQLQAWLAVVRIRAERFRTVASQTTQAAFFGFLLGILSGVFHHDAIGVAFLLLAGVCFGVGISADRRADKIQGAVERGLIKGLARKREDRPPPSLAEPS